MRFEIGKKYYWAESGFDPIEVVGRTAKSILVTNGHNTWMMRIKIDNAGNEYVIDSSMPKGYSDWFTCKAEWEVVAWDKMRYGS